ncbi:hypothetical protein PQX77_004870 [Marasmius sp. AFHP31]|nr:hypothetical protein PQX77_004870 [Marasmius sp. AFHP31]
MACHSPSTGNISQLEGSMKEHWSSSQLPLVGPAFRAQRSMSSPALSLQTAEHDTHLAMINAQDYSDI